MLREVDVIAASTLKSDDCITDLVEEVSGCGISKSIHMHSPLCAHKSNISNILTQKRCQIG